MRTGCFFYHCSNSKLHVRQNHDHDQKEALLHIPLCKPRTAFKNTEEPLCKAYAGPPAKLHRYRLHARSKGHCSPWLGPLTGCSGDLSGLLMGVTGLLVLGYGGFPKITAPYYRPQRVGVLITRTPTNRTPNL